MSSLLFLSRRKLLCGSNAARRWFKGLLVALLGIICFNPIINSSYSNRPSWYSGTNLHQEKVFVAANIVDADLIRGRWGEQLLQLVALLGKDNVFVSIYENDSGHETKVALDELRERMPCRHALVSGHIDLESYPTIQVLPGERRIKRIQYLADVRNKAIEPLANGSTGMVFDKLLFLNDVIFSPHDAADLLFATNAGKYRAACAVDFINPFKYYDTFATRDAEGYTLGVPFFPWFTRSGQGVSRRDVLNGVDAVRVKSCWGGMVAFQAQWFVSKPAKHSQDFAKSILPVKFRASDEIYWEASECCLVHADIAAVAGDWENGRNLDIGIYLNPYVRVAYDIHSYSWLGVAKQYERLFIIAHGWINWIAGLPFDQPRRLLLLGQSVELKEWVYHGPKEGTTTRSSSMNHIQEHGHWQASQRVIEPGGFCGNSYLLALKKSWQPGKKMWEKLPAPPTGNI